MKKVHDLDKTLELLAKDVLKEIKSFYSDSENLKKFEEWKKEQKEPEKASA